MNHMSIRRNVCCCPPLRLSAPKNYIWISEDVLNSAIHRFAHGRIPRRHVGLAPGPLEARKRATKRRMMNLAQAGDGGAFDPNLFPGLDAPERREWKWQSPTLLIPQRPEEPAPLPFLLTDPPPIGANERLEELEKIEDIEGAAKKGDPEQRHADLRSKNVMKNPDFRKDLRKCRDIVGLYNLAADYGIDVRMYPKILFRRLCHAGQPFPDLLYALEDAGLGVPDNLNFLLDWQFRKRKGVGQLRKGLDSENMILLQRWIRRQLYLGLKTEDDILFFLKFASRASDVSSDESLRYNLTTSIFEGLMSSSVFGFKDLSTETQCRLLASITRGPVTRQSLVMGFSLVKVMGQSQSEGTDQRISAIIGGVVHGHASLRECEKRETRNLEVIARALELLGGLPQELAYSAVLITTKALIGDHLRMPAMKAATMQLLETWWSALAEADIHDFSRETPLKTKIELLISTQKLEVAVSYLQQLDDRNQARFVLRYWVGPQTSSGQSRARYLFDEFCFAKGKDSPWISLFQAARECAQDSLQPSDADVKQVFKLLQMLRKSQTIVEIIKKAGRLDDIIDESDVVYTIREHLGTRPHLAERLFHFYPRLRLESCPELAERMILNDRSHPSTALRYMCNRRTRFPVHRERFLQLRTQLLDGMALAYSKALHITPRMAFRNVHKCYTQYAEERLWPPSVAIARALTQAGIIRPLRAGQLVSAAEIRWIISIIRRAEGDDVADQADEMVYKWRVANWRRFRRVRNDATNVFMDFRVRIKWSKLYRGYEKVYKPLKICSP